MNARIEGGITIKGCYKVLCCLALTMGCAPADAVERYVSQAGGHVPPFTDWVTAATNIQMAIDTADDGDLIWVTNGVYSTGGKVMAGDLTNRVALNKALAVRSVNGPLVTAIQGFGVIAGASAVRCAWLTNGAVLQGFTIRDGATREVGDNATLRSGGGIWCASSNVIVANCMIISNAAMYGGGAYQGNLQNCFLNGNRATFNGGGAYMAWLNSCTVTSNTFGGFYGRNATNCIVYFNSSYNWNGGSGSVLSYCCTIPMAPGAGNITAEPQLLDGLHLANTSPCRAAGINRVSGTDIDGQPWANPPSIGCEEWHLGLLVLNPPQVRLTTGPAGFTVSVSVTGQEPITCFWTRDGVPIENDGHYSSAHTTNLVANVLKPFDVGSYQVVVSNAIGTVTSAVVQLPIRCVDAVGTSPAPPYTSWATAATNIQDAIDVALTGDIVLVTNGVYSTGGKVKAGDLTNRVALDKALIVQSVNGRMATIIQGQLDPVSTNGPGAVRCAWLTNGATLIGFTLRGGATRVAGDISTLQSGGGVWCSASSAVVANCFIVNNSAGRNGGGATGGTLKSCAITGNLAGSLGGGTAFCALNNCTVMGNTAVTFGGGSYSDLITNSIIYFNTTVSFPQNFPNYSSSTMRYSCSSPVPSGTGNTNVSPQLLADGVHLAENSPCRGAGNAGSASGTDIDGQTWNNPPSMGCDEWRAEPLIYVQPRPRPATGTGQALLTALVTGQQPMYCVWSKDGMPLADGSHYAAAHTANLLIGGFGPGDAGDYQVVVSNAFGMATSQVTQVNIHCVDALGAAPVTPFTNWATAATTIQDAIEAAGISDVVLVTNGVYAVGGKVKSGALTNRVAVDKAMLVTSVNGPGATIIEGQWDSATTNGPGAVRCVWLGDGAGLGGFTLRGGATRFPGSGPTDDAGGGMWCNSTNAEAANCVITNNSAVISGGGAYRGTLNNCILAGNSVVYLGGGTGGGANGSALNNCLISRNTSRGVGGGVYGGTLNNCWLMGNSTASSGGGSTFSALNNCTLTGNSAAVTGGGSFNDRGVTNCIVFFNSAMFLANIGYSSVAYSCSTPLPSGTGNISDDPQLTDGVHLAVTSPCRGMGSSLYTSGTDIDGESWTNPPSMGCDEVWEAALTGPLSVTLTAAWPEVTVNGALPFTGWITGKATRLEWSFSDGPIVTDASYLVWHAWTNAGDFVVTFTAFNADNPGGVSTNLLVHVVPLQPPTLAAGGLNGINFQLQFGGQAGANYTVEYATNLNSPIAWLTLNSLSSTGGMVQIADTKATNSARFYRVRAQ